MTKAERYCEDVIGDKTVTGELMKLAVERHLNDLDASKRGDIPFVYSPARAKHCIDFLERMRHVEGVLANRRERFTLSDIQSFMTSVQFGWQRRHPDTGTWVRRFTKSYTDVARKFGKSAWKAATANYLTYGDGEMGAQVYSFATKLKQAQVVHGVSKKMTNRFIKENGVLRPQLTVLGNNISFLPLESTYEPLPANSDKQDGLNPHGAIGDEIHEFDDAEQINVIETGMGSRLQPMLDLITTAGFNIYGPCYKIRGDQIKVLKGINKDDHTCAFINTIDDGDDWHDRSVWPKSNPHIGITPYWSYMDIQYQKAINEGGRTEVNFITKNLNVWTTSGDTWVSDRDWMASTSGEYDLEILRGRPCYLGLDLSATKDLTVVVAIFPPTDGDPKFRILCEFYCPEDTIPERSKSDRVFYDVWAEEGYIKATPGRTVDYSYIIATLKEWKQKYNIKRLDYDPTFAYQLIDEIEALGIKCHIYGQNTKDMNPPINELERLILNKEIDHGAHPILRWNVSNVMLFTDSNGKVKFDKRKVVDKIDGCVAAAMALGGYLSTAPRRRSKYNYESMFPI